MEDLIILHEDNHVIVVLKPQNVPTCEDASGDEDLLTMVKAYIKKTYDKPGNAYVEGRAKATADHDLIYIQPGEKYVYRFDVQILDCEEELKTQLEENKKMK